MYWSRRTKRRKSPGGIQYVSMTWKCTYLVEEKDGCERLVCANEEELHVPCVDVMPMRQEDKDTVDGYYVPQAGKCTYLRSSPRVEEKPGEYQSLPTRWRLTYLARCRRSATSLMSVNV
jgi:hypothetical protein